MHTLVCVGSPAQMPIVHNHGLSHRLEPELWHPYTAHSTVAPNPITLCCTPVQKPMCFYVLSAPQRGSQPSHNVMQYDSSTRVSADLPHLLWLGGILVATSLSPSFIASGNDWGMFLGCFFPLLQATGSNHGKELASHFKKKSMISPKCQARKPA